MKASFLILIPFVAMCISCTQRVPVLALETPVTVANYFNCRIDLGGYFNEKYGLIKSGKRGMVILQFSIPQYAFSNSDSSASRKVYKPIESTDSRVIFYVDNKTVASGIISSITISDNDLSDKIEFEVSNSFGAIGYVEQGRNSVLVKLSDGLGTILDNIEKLPFEEDAWSEFETSGNSTVLLTVDSYRKRTGLSEVFTVDELKSECI